MKIEPEKLTMEYGREGLHISQAGREIAVVDCCQLAILHISYGDDLNETPAAFFCTRKERIIKWLKEKKEE